MEQVTRYTVTLFLAAPGTPLNSGGSSPRGHMYFQTAAGEEVHSYGFASPRLLPDEAAAGVQYAEVVHDDADEHRDPYYSRTLEISEEHYGCLRDFAEEPAEFGFDVDRPATINRCSDFVWAALHYAGLHSQPAPLDGGSNLGEFAVLFNLPEIQCIAAPFPASELNGEQHHPMPEREAELHREGGRPSDEPPPSPMEVAGTLLDPSHPDHRLFAQLIQKVAELDAAHGRTFDDTSQRISASLLVLAKQNNLSRVDHVLLSRPTKSSHEAESIFIVQGDRDDPGHRRASIATEVAAQTDVADSLRLKEQ
ncbi:hemolysin [Stenotrophomonas maltophilia]|nr:hemolysin [Stenotrophomonas maltophilia]